MRWAAITFLLLSIQVGCNRSPSAASQPAAAVEPLLPASRAWSKSEAAANLHDPNAAISAAVRLVRLSATKAVCVPDELRGDVARHLA
ncbi:MAG: hypothetical protein HY269_05335, partial [Deltaproteobacteria bacterium]|nr:hypothetical protein [Deltaproteobacteria bacterium]